MGMSKKGDGMSPKTHPDHHENVVKKPAKPQPVISQSDMAFLIKNYGEMGFKAGMTPAEMKAAMNALSNETPILKEEGFFADNKKEIMKATDAVKKSGVGTGGTLPEDVSKTLAAVNAKVEAQMAEETKELRRAARIVLDYNIQKQGLDERALDGKGKQPDMGAAKLAASKVNPNGARRSPNDEWETPAKIPSKAVAARKAPPMNDDEDPTRSGPPPAKKRGAAIA